MKKQALVFLILCGAATHETLAQSPAPAPPTPVPPASAASSGRTKRDRPRAFLGVEVSPVPMALSDQLNLPEGFGVLVDYVVPGSAAESAGVKPNDILKTLDGQIVTSADHLAVLVRNEVEGQEVSLVVLHKGQENKLTAKIQTREPRGPNLINADGRRVFDHDFDFDLDDPDTADATQRLQSSLERSRSQMNAATQRALAESRRALDEARERTARALASRMDFDRARVVLRDPTGRIELRMVRGKRTLKVRDKQGETLFEGPINTPEQRKAIPADVLPQVEALEREQEAAFPKDAEEDEND